jgi:hypothetical protein
MQFAGRAACPQRDEDDAGFTGGPEGIYVFHTVLGKNTDTIPWDERAEIGPYPCAT